MKSAWQRVSPARPCAACGKPDWCTYTPDGLTCCMRIHSDRQAGNGGWLHGGQLHFGDAATRMPYSPAEPEPAPTPALDADLWWQAARRAWNEPTMATWAEQLGLDVRDMDMFGACQVGGMLCFPMRDGAGDVTGIRTRTPDGQKRAVRGSRAGLFLPMARKTWGGILICEGPTDACAAFALEFDAVGRPSCQGCEDHVLATLRRFNAARATICADADGPGIDGAQKLAATLRAGRVAVRLVTPGGHKDLRDWYKAGATRAAVDAAWSQAAWR